MQRLLVRDYCRPIDNLGSEDGIESRLSWNITRPEHLHKIPTKEFFKLFDDWPEFLKVIDETPPRVN